MKLLLDTHTFLWFIGGDPRLNRYVRQLIEEFSNERWLSLASLWEMSIKVSLGKLKVPLPFTKLVTEHVHGNAIKVLNIMPEHLDTLRILPFYHKDPFDRLIIAQAISENIPILSQDGNFDSYPIQRFWS